jgi:putative hydrolase of the HAD superfamily
LKGTSRDFRPILPKTVKLLGDLGVLVVKTGGWGNVIRYPAPMTTTRLSAITFDAGGTMIYCDPSPGEIYAHHLSRLGRPVQAEEVGPVFRDAWTAMQRQSVPGQDRYNSVAGGELAWWGAFVREVLRRLDHDAPWEPLLDDLYAAFCEASVWKAYPETMSTLEALTDRGIRLAVISNWDRRLPDILRSLKIFEIFETVTVSSIEGVEKPSSEIFHRTLDRMGISVGETLHVGDSPLEDYTGAETAGLGAALIDRHELFVDEPYRRISSLEEILEMVGR